MELWGEMARREEEGGVGGSFEKIEEKDSTEHPPCLSHGTVPWYFVPWNLLAQYRMVSSWLGGLVPEPGQPTNHLGVVFS